MDFQMISGISSLITSIGTFAAVIVAINMFVITKNSIIEENRRHKKQSTIEYYNTLSNDAVPPLMEALSKALGKSETEIIERTIIPTDQLWIEYPGLKSRVIYYCRCMERFAVGIEIGIFDYDTFYAFSGKTVACLFLQIRNILNKIEPTNFCAKYKLFCEKLLNEKQKRN